MTSIATRGRWARWLVIGALLAFLLAPALAMAGPRSGGSFSGRGGFRSGGGAYSRGPARPPAPRGPNVVVVPGFGWGFLPFGLGGGSVAGTLMVVGLLGLGAVVVLRAVRRSHGARGGIRRGLFGGEIDPDQDEADANAGPAPGRAFVYKLQVGLGRSARGIQQRLESFAAEGDTASEEGLAHLLSQTALELLREKHSIRYLAAEGGAPLSLTSAEIKLNGLALAERSRFQIERVRSAEGKVRRSDASATRKDEVLEYLMVTILVATRVPLPGLHDLMADGGKQGGKLDPHQRLETALEQLGGVPARALLGLEVVWTPADPEDALTEAELLLAYPDLRAV